MTAGLLEEGFYTLKVESAEYGVSSDGKSQRAIVNFSVVGTEYEGYEIKSVFSLDNPSNPKSERISQKTNKPEVICHDVKVCKYNCRRNDRRI